MVECLLSMYEALPKTNRTKTKQKKKPQKQTYSSPFLQQGRKGLLHIEIESRKEKWKLPGPLSPRVGSLE